MKLNLITARICSGTFLILGLLAGAIALTGTAPASSPVPVLVAIEVTPANSTVPAGHNRQFTATGTFSDGSTQDLTALATWSSSDGFVAVVSNAFGSQGLATGVAPGMTQINAQLDSISGSTNLTVTDAVLVAIEVRPVNPSVLVGLTQQFTAIGTFSDGTTQDLTASAAWSSSDRSIGKVSNAPGSNGSAIGVAPGTTEITASFGDVSGSTTLTVTSEPGCQLATSISANFNAAPINKNSYIWFNSVLKPKGLGSTPATFRFVHQQITSASFTLSVPDATVIFDPAITTATTTFTGGVWTTRVPSSISANTFLSGLSYLVPANLPGGLKNVTWSGTIIPDTAGTSLQWQWAAAVYSNFSSNYNALGVKPVDDTKASQYKNADHAGTPENFKTGTMGGATGGGATNYTGSLSGTKSTAPCDATPNLLLTKSAPAFVNNTQIPYTITYRNLSSRPVSNIILSDTLPAGTTYIVGTGVPAPTSVSGNTLTWNLPNLAPNAIASVVFRVSVNTDGIYNNTAGVRFTQAVGAISSNTVTTRRDTVPPSVTIVSGPNGVTNVISPSFQFITDSSAVGSQCTIDNGSFTPCAPAPSQYTSGPLAEGAHTFTVRVFDVVGNMASASRTFTVDLTGPVVTFSDPPINPTISSSSTPRFFFSVSADAAGPTTAFCSVAGDPFAPCASPFTTRSLTDGAYTVSVFARDGVGNQGPTANFSFVVDTHPPIVSIPVPPNVTTTNDNTPTFTFADVGPAGTPVTFQCRVDANPNVPCTTPFTVAPALADGLHTLTVTGTDAANNVGQASLSFTVDTSGP